MFSINNNQDGDIVLNMDSFPDKAKVATTLKGGFFAKIREASNRKTKDSIFDFENEKKQWKLTKDSSSMGYGVFLKKEFNGGLDFQDDQRS